MKALLPNVNLTVGLGLVSLAIVVACGRTVPDESSVQWVASPGMSKAEVDTALKATLAVQLNLKTNRATLYRDGVPQQQWNIASADVSGEYHNGEPKFTPEGIYGIEDLEHCPAWLPRDPVNPATGRIAQSEAERWQIFNTQPEVYGPCGSRNPLGKYVFWFQGPYGMHGNSAEEILRLKDPEDRRVSGGCIRNPNEKIKEIFHIALDAFPELSAYKQSVVAMEAQTQQRKRTLTQPARNINMRVVVGRWASDPAVGGGSSQPSTPVVTPAPTPAPTPMPAPVGPVMLCKAVAVDPKSGVAPLHIRLPATAANISGFYRLKDPVRVLGLIPGTTYYQTGRGFIEKSYLGECKPY